MEQTWWYRILIVVLAVIDAGTMGLGWIAQAFAHWGFVQLVCGMLLGLAAKHVLRHTSWSFLAMLMIIPMPFWFWNLFVIH